MPAWVNSVENGYIIVTAKGADIEEAKLAALNEIKKQVSESIATRIVSESSLRSQSLEVNDNYSYSQELKSNINSRTAKLPFINEISLSKASEFYWEVRLIKATKANESFYAVKYPFSEFDMKKLVMEFQKHDAELNTKLKAFESGLNTVTSLEDIDKAIVDIKAFLNEFLNDDPRYAKAESISNQYRKLYEYVVIDAYQIKKGMVVSTLVLNDRQISSRQKPTIKSNCATKLTTSFEGNVLTIKYDDFGCYDEDENYIEIRYRLGNKFGTQKVYIKTALNVSLTGTIFRGGTKVPVSFAKVTIVPGGKTMMTGTNGVYQFNDLADGNYNIQVSRKGYESTQESITVRKGTIVRDIVLTPNQESEREDLVIMQARPTSDPASTVRNGLVGYYRFNYSTANELASAAGQIVGNPLYVDDAPDGTKALQFDPIDGGYFLIPACMIQMPITNYSITFWAKGLSNGHIFSSSTGTDKTLGNVPALIVEEMRLKLVNRYEDEVKSFSHNKIPYEWHFFAFVVSKQNDQFFQTLYIDGQPMDKLSFTHVSNFPDSPTKFIFGGQGMLNKPAVGMTVDNLRIYNSRALSDSEVMEIYKAEQ